MKRISALFIYIILIIGLFSTNAQADVENVVLSANGGVLESFTSEYGSGWVASDLTNGVTNEDGWSSAVNPGPQEFVFSFKDGKSATLNEAVIYSGTAEGIYFSRDVEVWTSADGNNYTMAASGSLAQSVNSITLSLGGTVAERVKLIITSGYRSDYWELGEFVVNGFFEYALSVNSGSGDGNYESGIDITITADAAPTDQEFDQWVVNSGSPTIADVNAASTTLTMPASDVTITATYKDIGLIEYCTSSGNDNSYEWIAGVQIGSLNNTSGASGYTDFTNLSLNVSPNDSVSVTLTPGFASGSYTEYFKIWIDYNLDGDFADPGEEVFSNSGSSAVSGSFTVPGSAAGVTRMRVSMSYNTAPPYCGTFTYGEVEDYTINIAASTYALSVGSGSGSGSYTAGTDVTITADAAPSGQEFDQWEVNSGSPTIADFNAASTTLTMPAGDVTVTATYRDLLNPPPTVGLSVSDNPIIAGQSTLLSWTSAFADSVTIEPDPGIGEVPINGSTNVTPSVTTTYTVTATNTYGTATDTVVVTVYQIPTVSISANPTSIVAGESTTLDWASTDADIDVYIAPLDIYVLENASYVVSPLVTTTYTITATGNGGTATDSVEVVVNQPPTVNITAAPNPINIGEIATLTWAVSNADTVSIDHGVGTDLGLNGSCNVAPVETTTYTITAENQYGTTTDSVQLVVNQMPTVSITASPDTINEGDSVTLSWTSTDASTVTIDNEVGSVTPVNAGSVVVSPSETTAYTIMAEGAAGSVQDQVIVTVTEAPPPPTVSIYASPETIISGGVSTLTWTSAYATTGSINPLGELLPADVAGGSIDVSPAVTTTYTITVTGTNNETASDTFTINVISSTGIKLETGIVSNVGGSSWTTVNLSHNYNSMVVVATPNYDGTVDPCVTRIRNASGSSFDVRVDPAGGITPAGLDVYYMVVEEGVYTQGDDGATMEAVKFLSTVTDENNSWVGEARTYQNTYSSPVVLGQVMTYNDAAFSYFWARGSLSTNPPDSSTLYVGKAVGEDTDVTRANETIGYVVIEAGSGTIEGVNYITYLGPDTIRGVDNSATGYTYSISGLSNPYAAVLSAAAMDGANGGWPVLYGLDPISTTSLNLVFDEDVVADTERNHSTEQVAYAVFEAPVVTANIYASPSLILTGESATLTWSTTNATSVILDDGINTSTIGASGSMTTGSLTETTTYTITAQGPGGTVTDSVTVNVNQPVFPTVSISASPSTIDSGGTSTLTWTSTNATSAILDNGVSTQALGSVNGSLAVGPLTANTTYTITVTGPYGTASDSVTVSVNQPPPTVSISASPNPITQGQNTTLTWSSTNANTITISPGIGYPGYSGNEVPPNGSYTVSPAATTIYTITVQGDTGTASDTLIVTVNPLPTVSISASPNPIAAGQNTMLTWSSTNADDLTIDHGLGTVAVPGGSIATGILSETTTFIITASNVYGSSTAAVTVAVNPAPAVSITASPNPITSGGSSTLSWTSTNAGSASISGIGAVAVNGTYLVSPIMTTTYTITVTGPGGTATDSVTVTVAQGPAVSITASPNPISGGGISTLSWTSSNSDSVEIDNGIGTVTPNTSGSQTVTPSVTTTYIITATKALETATDSVTVIVNPVPTVSITASPNPVTQGETSTLNWGSTNADTASISGIGAVVVNGTYVVTPSMTTTYTITVNGPGGTASDSVTVTVNMLPSVNITASPNPITIGQGSTLSWSSLYVDTVSIDQGIGTLTPNTSGTMSVTPSVTTTYTITGSNAQGTATDSVTVVVDQVPTVTISASPNPISVGNSATLSWTSTAAASASIDQGIGSVSLDGTYVVSPAVTTRYTITVTGPGGSASDYIDVTVNQGVLVSLSADPGEIIAGGSTTLTWTSENATSVSIDQGIGAVTLNGSRVVTPALTTTYTISATGPGGTSTDNTTVTVYQIPTVTISATPNPIAAGQNSTLSWNSANADTASIDQGIGAVNLSGSRVVAPVVTTIYTITVDGPGGTATDFVEITVNQAPVVSITASPASIDYGQTSTLLWSSANADSAQIDQGIGTVTPNTSGSQTVSPLVTTTYTIIASGPGGTASDSATVIVSSIPLPWHNTDVGSPTLPGFATFSGDIFSIAGSGNEIGGLSDEFHFVYQGLSGNGEIIARVDSLDNPDPWAMAGVMIRETLDAGSSHAMMILSSGNGTSFQRRVNTDGDTFETIENDGLAAPYWVRLVRDGDTFTGYKSSDGTTWSQVGSASIPMAVQVYVGLAVTSNYDGSYCNGQISNVQVPSFTASLNASPDTIIQGASSTLSWVTTYANTVSIDQGIGTVAASGSRTVSPSVTTTYTITATGDLGTLTDSTTVTVYQVPSVNIDATPNPIPSGGTTSLVWTSTNVDSAVIDQGIGSVAVNGSFSVSPLATTTYTITVSGDGGTATDSITVTVYELPTVSISASQNPITIGESTNLAWNSANALSASIDQGIGTVSVNGSVSVSPVVTTTYTITVIGQGSTIDTDSVTITVDQLPTVDMIASPNPITIGETTTLSWSSTNADSASISNIGPVLVTGTYGIAPVVTTAYTITVTGPGGTATDSVTVTVYQLPTVTLSAFPNIIASGEPSTLSWNSSNAVTVSIDQGIGTVGLSGTYDVSPSSTTVYTITATGPGGTTTDSVTVTVGQTPAVSMIASPNPIIVGQSTNLTWTSQNAISASIDNLIGAVTVNGSRAVSPAVTTTYTITVSGVVGTATDSVTVTVNALPPTVDISASPNPITSGQQTALSWTSTDATSASIDQGVGAVPVNGTANRSPVVTTTYTITVNGPGGMAQDSVTVAVNAPAPTVSISATPINLETGGLTTLSWTSTDADTVSIDQSVGTVALNGTIDVAPGVTTTYTITATGPGGTASDLVTVNVYDSVAVTINASPNPITSGGSSTLTWTSSYADSVSIDQGIGTVVLSGSMSVMPAVTTNYTITAVNAFGSDTDSVTVTVSDVVSVNIFASPNPIIAGNSTTLTWASNNATSASIDNGVGSVPFNGSTVVTPSVTTIYTITVTDGSDTSQDSIRVTVNEPLPVVSITANSMSISNGESTTLMWISTDANTVSIDQGVGVVELSGTRTVSPSVITTYTVTAVNSFGTVTDSVTIDVDQLLPVIQSFTSTPNPISSGDLVRLAWSVSGAQSVTIDQGLPEPFGIMFGTKYFNLDETTTYTLTATNSYGSTTKSVTVVVDEPPVVSLSALPESISYGEFATLVWSVDAADYVSIDQSIGSVEANGTQIVSPLVSTTYTITATNKFGASVSDATVIVAHKPTVSISADPSAIIEGNSTTLTWTSTEAYTASIDNGIGDVAVNGSLNVSPLVTTMYTITVSGDGGFSDANVIVQVHPVPQTSITVLPEQIIQGESANLSWTSVYADSVSIDHGIGEVALSGSWIVSPRLTTTYTVTAASNYGSATDTVTITVNPLPTVDISANPTSITLGETSTLSWSSTDADTLSIDQGIGTVDANGTYVVSPIITTTYTISVSNTYGTDTDSVTITVHPRPVVNISADDLSIIHGGTTYLTWTSQYAQSAIIDQGIGPVDLNGSVSISPTVTTTYTITASSSYGVAADSVTINVTELPTVTINATPAEITLGESSTLSWNSVNADSLIIDQGIGTVAVQGTRIVTPTVTTTYIITATNTYGTDTESVTVIVHAPPSADISASPATIMEGNSSVITWNSSNADTVVIDQGIGTATPNTIGSAVVAPLVTTTYTITASNTYGSVIDSVIVTVTNLPAVSIEAFPTTIITGESSTLSWSSVNADSVEIDQGIGIRESEGSWVVSPAVTTTYTVTATNASGSVADSVTVSVNALPVVNIQADPPTITEGASTTLSWSTSGADSVNIDQGIGAVTPNVPGSFVVAPTVTTTYTITATNTYGSVDDSVTVIVSTLPSVSINASPATINIGENSTLAWSSVNAETVEINEGIGLVNLEGTWVVSPEVTTTYTITATNIYGPVSDNVTINVNALPVVSFSASPVTINEGGFSTLSWSTTGADSANIDQGIGTITPNVTGSMVVYPTVTTTYKLTATNTNGSVSQNITVTVSNLPTVSIEAFPMTITIGENSTLSWSSVNADTVQIDQGIGTVAANSSSVVSPVVTTAYTISATNSYGTVTDTVTVNVNALPVINSYTADPATITQGGTSALTWDVSGADTLNIDQSIGTVVPAGTTNVTPTITTTYKLTATNTNGSVSQNVTVTVSNLPTVSIEAFPTTITIGENSTLSWSSVNADTIQIDQGIGTVAANSSSVVTPAVTTQYTITATNAYGSATDSVTITVNSMPGISISASPATIVEGDSSTLSWISTNATSVSINQSIGSVALNDSRSVSPIVTTTYIITATNTFGSMTDNVTVVVNKLPTVSIAASPTNISVGETSSLSWSTTYADSVTMDQGIGTVDLNGTHVVTPSVLTTYTITASNAYGTATATVSVLVSQPPTVSITASVNPITEGQSTDLTWTSSGADSVSIDQGIGSEPAEGYLTVSPVSTVTYTITAVNAYGSTTSSVTVTVNNLPVVSMTAEPATIFDGDASTLTWSSALADSLTIDQGIGTVAASGSTSVTPLVTTTYTITATNTYGYVTDTAIVTVNPLPTASITATPTSITEGGSSTLDWSTTNAESISIDQGIGSVSASSSTNVSPVVTTTYTITASNAYGSVTSTATVTVNNLPTVNITADPATIFDGDTATLTWSSTLADSISIDYGVGTVAASGSASVSPVVTTTYTITATNTYGSVNDTATVTVNPLPTVNMTSDMLVLARGSSATLTWSTANADSINIDHGIGTVAASGSMSVSPVVNTTYTITASNAYGSASDSLTITVGDLPSANINAEPEGIVSGGTSTLSWSSEGADSVSIDQGIGTVAESGSQIIAPVVTTTYTITASNAFGSVSDAATVTIYGAPSVIISADPEIINEGSPSTLTWTSAEATSASIDQGIGDVDVNGSIAVSPMVTTAYMISVTGPGGTSDSSVTVTVNNLPVIDSISASPTNIASGQSTTLSWTTTNAVSASIDQGVGTVDVIGSTSVMPIITTTYTLTASNGAGDCTANITVIVGMVPTVDMYASDEFIAGGETSMLSWFSSGADTVDIDNGIGTVTLSGSYEAAPGVTTTYIITATNTYGTTTDSVTINVGSLPAASIAVSATPITEGASTTLSWDSTGADTVTIDSGIGTVIVNAPGSQVITPASTTTYTITAENAYGITTDSVTVNVNMLPTVSLSASPLSIGEGASSLLAWSSTLADSVSIDQGIGAVAASGNTSVSPVVTTTYTVTATNIYGSVTDTATITVNLLPTASITATPAAITEGGSSTLDWSTANADSIIINQGIGAVVAGGSTSVSPVVTTTYTITASNAYGSAMSTATVTVNNLPTVNITADHSTIFDGESSTLIWSTTLADSISIDQGIGAVGASGSTSVSPVVTTTYTVTATNIYGSVTDTATITVNQLPAASITASLETITEGEASTLSWNTTNANGISIDQGVGAVASSGSMSMSPVVTTTYTVTAVNTYGSAESSVTVAVNPLPTVSISADPTNISSGESSILAWATTLSDTVEIDQGLGIVALNGFTAVSPATTTTYTVTATNAYGSRTDTVTVMVSQPPTVSISALPNPITQGQTSTLTWTSNGADTVTINQGIGTVDSTGSMIVSPSSTITYMITASNTYGSVTDSVTVTVNSLPTVSLIAEPASIAEGSSSILTWTSTNATTLDIDQGIGTVSASGSQSVTPSVTTTYTITATNTYGSVTDTAVVTVSALPVVNSFTAVPANITQGQSSAITWAVTNADTVSINQGIGPVGASGTTTVTPSVTTTYTITANNAAGTVTSSVTVTVNSLPTVSVTASPASIAEGSSSILTWTSTNATTLEIDQGIGTVSASGSQTVTPSVTTTYTITATNTYGSVTDTVVVTVSNLPVVDIETADTSIVEGQTATLSWSSSNADTVSIDHGVGTLLPNTSGTSDVTPTVTTMYTITANNAAGTVTDSVTVTVNNLPSVSLSADPATIAEGSSSILTWTSTNATTLEIDQGIGTVAASGSQSITPTVTTTYTITATNANGTVADTATVTVSNLPVVSSFTAVPATITQGQASAITWAVTNADTVSINQGIGTVAASGTTTVTPSVTTTYTITANNAAGTVTNSATVTVNSMPTVSLSADPASIAEGSSSILTWTSANATILSISPGIGSVGTSGSTSVMPSVTTTYIITATNGYGSVTSSATVTVSNLPTVSISANPIAITEGQGSTLNWSSTLANEVSIDHGIGIVALNGSTNVVPTVTTTYTITASNEYGSVNDSVTISIGNLPTVILEADPVSIDEGSSTTLTWTSTNATGVIIDQGIGTVGLSGSMVVTLSVTTTYTITATNSNGSRTDTVTIAVNEPPTVSIFVDQATISQGASSTLSWNSSGAESVSIDQGIGTVTLTGSRLVSPSATTTYTVIATNHHGSVSESITITVNPLPTVNIEADPVSLNSGSSAKLSWSSTGADSLVIDNGVGTVSASGSMSVTPATTTTYTITATNTNGSITDSVTITVNQLPNLNINVDLNPIITGDSTTLIWTSTYADTVSIDNGIGAVALNGNLTVAPAVTTTYMITATNTYGSRADSVTVTVYQIPTVTISVDPPTIVRGETATLSWISTDANTAVIDHGIGVVGVNGSLTVSPDVDTTYTILVTGPAGEASDTVTLIVYQPPTASISADTEHLISGESAILTWTSQYADSAVLYDGDSSVVVELNGTTVVSPSVPSTYTVIVNGPGGQASDAVTIGVVPREAAYVPRYETHPSDPVSYHIDVLDLETNTVSYTIDDIGNMPVGIEADPAGNYLYVSCYGDHAVNKIDVFTGEVIASVDVVDMPRDLAITPDGTLLYVSMHNSNYNGDVVVIDTTGDMAIDSIIEMTNDSKSIAMSSDGASVYASSGYVLGSPGDYFVNAIDAATGHVDDEVNVGDLSAFDLAVSPDGSRVYMANQENGLSYIDTDTLDVVPVMSEYSKDYVRVLTNQDGSLVYVATISTLSSQLGISVIDPDNVGSAITIGLTPMYEFLEIKGMAQHPTEPYLYVICNDTDNTGLPDVYVIDTSTNTVIDTMTIGKRGELYGNFLIIR